jgi:hypothetical protein
MVFWWELLKITCVSSLKLLKDLVINKVTQGTGDGEMGKWGNGEMGKWGNGEMGKWGNGKIQLKP